MHWRAYVWFVALIGSAVALMLTGCRAGHESDADKTNSAQPAAVLHAQGTIVNVEEQAHDEQSYDLLPGPRVCFTFDSLNELSGADRDVYESAERERQEAHGPRCRDTSIDPSVVRFNKGDPVEVYYTLQNAGQISIVRVSSHGADF
jgi:hypothetical protein